MIIGCGIDSSDIIRFAHWHTFTHKQLSRFFSAEEIEYCISNTKLSAQRFAVRFAAREAAFKALAHIDSNHTVPFLSFCRVVTITKQNNGAPKLTINWQNLSGKIILPAQIQFFLSLTHTASTATALVMCQTYR